MSEFYYILLYMLILTAGRKQFLLLHFTLLYLCYFTHRTVVRRFFPQVKQELKWILVTLYCLTMLHYATLRLTRRSVIHIKNTPDVATLGVTQPHHIAQLQKTCDKCRLAWQPPRAVHCYQCGTCVFRQDHHSDWFNTCISVHNQKSLMLFSASAALIAVLTLAINLTAMVIWSGEMKKPLLEGGLRITFTKLIVMSLVVLSLGLAFLCLNWGVGQYFNVKNNQTNQESLDGDLVGRPADFQTNFESICGRWGWWLPLPAHVSANYLELLYTKQHISKTSQYVEDIFDQRSAQYYKEYQKYVLQ